METFLMKAKTIKRSILGIYLRWGVGWEFEKIRMQNSEEKRNLGQPNLPVLIKKASSGPTLTSLHEEEVQL